MSDDQKVLSVRDVAGNMHKSALAKPRLRNEEPPSLITDFEFIAAELADYKARSQSEGDLETEWQDDSFALDPDWDSPVIQLFNESGLNSNRADHWRLLLCVFAEFYATRNLEQVAPEIVPVSESYKWTPERQDLLLQRAAEVLEDQSILRADLWKALRNMPDFLRKGLKWKDQRISTHTIRSEYTRAKNNRVADLRNGKFDDDPVRKQQLIDWILATEKDAMKRQLLIALRPNSSH